MNRRAQAIGGISVLMILFTVAVVLWLRPWARSPDRMTPELLQRAVTVLAMTENGKRFPDAILGWSELLMARPDDRDLLLNQAVTVLKWISNTNSELSSGSITDPQNEKALAAELQLAYAEADRVLKRLAGPDGEANRPENASGLQALLESALLEARSRVLPYPDDMELRKSAAETLLDALGHDAQQPLLAVRLFDLAQELQSDWPEIIPRATEAAYLAWKSQPRNLYLLVRTGESLLAQKDPRVLELVDASVDLAQPLLPMLPGAKQLNPEELTKDVRTAVEAGDWPKAQRIRGWFNVLRASSAFRADNRLVNPDILALLNTSFLERWRDALPAKSRGRVQPRSVQVSTTPLLTAFPDNDSNATDLEAPGLLAWYDYDVDRDFDILGVRGPRLRITPWDGSGPSAPFIDVTLPIVPRGMCIVDLWSVDSPQRPRKPVSPENAASAAIDGNAHDTLQEVILWSDQSCIVLTRTSDAASAHTILADVEGLTALQHVRQMVPLDLDSDGDLDLAVVTDNGIQFLQNNGNRTFEDITRYSSLSDSEWIPNRLIACDFDRDLDIDLIACSNTAPSWAVLENILHSQFRFRPLEAAVAKDSAVAVGPLDDAVVLELDGNGSWDWAGIGGGAVSGVLTRTTAAGMIAPSSQFQQTLPKGSDLRQLRCADLNLDGHPDLCLAGPSGITTYFGDGVALAPSPQTLLSSNRVTQLDIQDADQDGRLELLAVVDGQASLHRIGPSKDEQPHYLEARIRGIGDVNGGGRINHYAIGSVLELWSDGHYQAQVINSPVTHFGLPGAQADNLRIIFNNGLTQNAPLPRTDTLLLERQELRGSCPFVYGFNGENFELITDLLWNAPLGLQIARGRTLPNRRWENLLLPGHLVQPHDGAIELRVTEELWEVAYFDHLALTAVDHPAGVEVWTNEKVGPPQLAEPRLFVASQPIRPLSARDGYGRDMLDKLSHRDQVYAQPFIRQLRQGLCESHSMELEFDPERLAQRNDLRLVLTGWMHPTDTSLNIGIAQNPLIDPPAPPSLWAYNAQGALLLKQRFMGFPGGKPKTIVIDLTDVFTPGAEAKLRIEGSQQIYWDEAYIIADEAPAPLRTEALSLQSADLHYRGFSKLMPRASDQPHWYDYTQTSAAAKWPPLDGPFTRFGSVLGQTQADDDRIVVMTSGDEMTLRFALPSRPLPNGWRRDYVLHSVGWDKDADINTLEGQSSLPLPFAAMHHYPPTQEQSEQIEQTWQINADSLTERSLFDLFWHPLPSAL